MQRRQCPRLVVIQFPCIVWSQLVNLNYRTPSRKRELDEPRRHDMVFLESAAEMARIQIENGDYFVMENRR